MNIEAGHTQKKIRISRQRVSDCLAYPSCATIEVSSSLARTHERKPPVCTVVSATAERPPCVRPTVVADVCF